MNLKNYLTDEKKALSLGIALLTMQTIALAQDQVVIRQLGRDGKLEWSVPTTNAVSTVEWSHSVDGPWNQTWADLLNLNSNETTLAASVPMFYRISTWTNGLLAEVRPGVRMTYRAQDQNGRIWNSEWDLVGYITFPGIDDTYTMMRRPEYGDSFEGVGEDVNFSMMVFQATANKVVEYEGREQLLYQDASVGTVWTNEYRETTGTVTITAREEITVPADSFSTIKHVVEISDPHCCGLPARVVTWVARGVGVVRQERYLESTDPNPGRTYELLSVKMLDGPQ